MPTKLSLLILLLTVLPAKAVIVAAEHSSILPFVTDDVVAVAYIDLKAVDLRAVLDEVKAWGAMPPGEQKKATTVALAIQDWVTNLIENGAKVAYAPLRVSDVAHGGPTWVLSLTDDARPDALSVLLKAAPGDGGVKHCRQVNDVLLAAMHQTQIESLVNMQREKPRAAVVNALDELGNGAAGLAVIGNADSRRVLREMLPRLPAPFNQIDGRLLADDLLWGGAVLDLPPTLKATIHVETSDVEIASTLHQSALAGLEVAKQTVIAQLIDTFPEVSSADIQQALVMIKPTVDNAAIRLRLGNDAEQTKSIRRLLSSSIAAACERTMRKQRIGQFRQLVLAALNYESAHAALPQHASYDAAGRPLLSWRVHVLPYLDETELYREFHLDEPWDSPHNRQLIAQMPAVYSDPSAAVRGVVGDVGRTTFVAPVAAETAFPPKVALPKGKPLTFRDFTDGISNTIMFVEVVPERAVVWTRPEDWEVDLNHALNGLRRADRSGFTVAFCDGHVLMMDNDTSVQKIRGMLTRAGGELVE